MHCYGWYSICDLGTLATQPRIEHQRAEGWDAKLAEEATGGHAEL